MKKILGLAIGMLFLGTILLQAVLAGDENDPEFTDDEQDVRMWNFFKGPLANTLFKNVDILACWFHETPEQPNTLFVTFKMKDLRFGFFNTTYTAMWEFQDKTCFAYCGHHLFNKQLHAMVGYSENYSEYRYESSAEADITKNTITIAVPKNLVGSPAIGDQLHDALIGAFIIPNQSKLLFLFPLLAMFAYDEAVDGKDYTIQY